MPVTFTTLSRQLNFHLSAETSGELAPFIATIVSPSAQGMQTVELTAMDMDELTEALAVVARQLDDPDRIEAIRVDEMACALELDIAARPVDARRLH
jgi:hypothetical protein